MSSGRTAASRLGGLAGSVLVLLFCLFPLWWMARSSVLREPEIFGNGLYPRNPTLDNYRLLLSGTYRFGLAIRNSLVIATATTLVAVAVGTGTGYALARLRVRARPPLLGLLLALAMLPGIAVVPGFYQLFAGIGWLDSYPAVVLPDVTFALPLAGWLLARTLAEFPWELEDAALVDGAGRWTALRRVVLPLAAPGVAAAAMVVFVFTWNEYLFAAAMTLTPASQPVTVAITYLPGVAGFGVAMAAGVLVTGPVVGVLLLLQRHVTASLAGTRTPARSRAVAAVRRGATGGDTTWRRRHPAGPLRRPLAALLAVVVLALVLGSSLPAPVPGARADDGARIVAVETIDRRTVDLTVDSPALGRTGKARLLLPDRFAAEPARRWPLLYLLHGCCDSYVSWTRSTDVEQLTEDAGVLVVMPEAGRAGFYSDWYNGGRGGPPRWETFHLVELRQLLERNYRADGRRAVAGLSMGGLGATAYAARHPGMFRAVASFSGILDTWPDDTSLVLGLLRSFGDDPLALWGDPDRQAAVWRDHDPAELASGLRGTALFVGFGDGRPGPFDGPDAAGTTQSMLEARLHAQNERFAARLRALRIPARVDDYGPGIHDWPYWQRELHRAWPMLLRSLGA